MKEEIIKTLIELIEEYGNQPADYDCEETETIFEFLNFLKKKYPNE